jgi:3-hydroxyethyl bacteriochlorophyllide a dehydrogenase
MDSQAVVFEAPAQLTLRTLELKPAEDTDVVVEVAWSGISTGTERLLYTGCMPPFPGLAYPLVPGYESVGEVVDAGPAAKARIGERVFVPGSAGFKTVRGLFGGAAKRLVAPSARVVSIDPALGETGVLIALAATAAHAIAGGPVPPDLVIGHGVLGRLIARITVALGAAPPTVWETNEARRGGAVGYAVVDPQTDERRDYRAICDASGDSKLLGPLISRLAKGGEVILAGFYDQPLTFDFPPAFIREARLRVAAEWAPEDLASVVALIDSGALSLDGLITHRRPAALAAEAYATAFSDAACLKMVLAWAEQ